MIANDRRPDAARILGGLAVCGLRQRGAAGISRALHGGEQLVERYRALDDVRCLDHPRSASEPVRGVGEALVRQRDDPELAANQRPWIGIDRVGDRRVGSGLLSEARTLDLAQQQLRVRPIAVAQCELGLHPGRDRSMPAHTRERRGGLPLAVAVRRRGEVRRAPRLAGHVLRELRSPGCLLPLLELEATRIEVEREESRAHVIAVQLRALRRRGTTHDEQQRRLAPGPAQRDLLRVQVDGADQVAAPLSLDPRLLAEAARRERLVVDEPGPHERADSRNAAVPASVFPRAYSVRPSEYAAATETPPHPLTRMVNRTANRRPLVAHIYRRTRDPPRFFARSRGWFGAFLRAQ